MLYIFTSRTVIDVTECPYTVGIGHNTLSINTDRQTEPILSPQLLARKLRKIEKKKWRPFSREKRIWDTFHNKVPIGKSHNKHVE